MNTQKTTEKINNVITRRRFLKSMAAGSAYLLASRSLADLTQDCNVSHKPNIIVMLADDLGYGDLGCYGCPDIRTPNIDLLAANGVRFTDAYCSAPVCSPTRAALLTGCYQQRLGNSFEDYLGDGVPGIDPAKHKTVGTYLKEAGYSTVCYGKWNVGGEDFFTPMDHGFDEWVGMDHNHNYFSHLGYDHVKHNWSGKLRMWQNRENKDIPGYTTDVFGDLAVNYIENYKSKKPFFMYLAWQAPHSPLQPPDAKYKNEEEIINAPKDCEPYMRPNYIKIVSRLDYQIGRIANALKMKGIDKDTLVIFTSDNGGDRAARNLPLKGFKQDLDEGGIRVPFLMCWPGNLVRGKVTSQMAITFDITKTILSQAGVNTPVNHKLDGIDLLPYVNGEKKIDVNRTLFWRRRTFNSPGKINKVRAKAVRQGQWKYHKDLLRNREYLYNLKDDISETKNLLHEKPETAAKLKNVLQLWESQVTPAV